MNFAKVVAAALIAQVIVIGFFVIGGLLLLGVAVSLDTGTGVEEDSWLVIDVYGDIPPYYPPQTVRSKLMGGEGETLHRILSNLEKAVVDDNIAGVIMKVSSSNGLRGGGMDEIRTALGRLRDTGKPVYAWSDDLDRNSLWLAGACDSIFLAPAGDVTFIGMAAVREYYKGTLDKLGIKPQLNKIKDYKTAAEAVTRSDMSEEAREMANWMLDEYWEMQLDDIASDRGITRAQLERHMEYAMFVSYEAEEAGFVDGVMFYDDLKRKLAQQYGGDDDDKLRTISQSTYDDVTRADVGIEGDKTIAVVHAWGSIGGRKSKVSPALGTMMGHQTVVNNLRRAANDDDVDAIVFRVDSGGGESLASEIIAHEVGRIRNEKPIVVSMVDVAASGGYAISYKATKIVADRTTITGSIGSIHGKMNMVGLYNKLGLSYDWVSRGPNAMWWMPITDFDDEQWERMRDYHNRGFDLWLEDIARERGMTVEELTALAHGRVWTGRQALENGLIDELGGLDRAIELAREVAEIDTEDDVNLVHYPERESLLFLVTAEGGPFSALRTILYNGLRSELRETERHINRSDMRWGGRAPR
jgi:protease-4